MGDKPAAVENNPELVDTIADMAEEVFGDGDLDALADDAAMVFFRDASEQCDIAGVERSDRVDVIMAGLRQFVIQNAERSLEDIRWQLETMFSL